MNKRIKSLLLCLVMAFTLAATAAPALAASAEPAPVSVDAEVAPVSDGETSFTPDGDGDTTTITPSSPGSTDINTSSYSISFTKIVELGGDVEPGEQDFELEIIPQTTSNYSNYTYSTSLMTDGAGTFDGTLTITGTDAAGLVTEGFYVCEKNDGIPCWTYSTAAYFVAGEQSDGSYAYKFFEATNSDGVYTTVNSDPLSAMSFTNTYTEDTATVEIPFVKTVKLGGEVAPGKQDFELEIVGASGNPRDFTGEGVSYTATVSTNGAGEYEGKLVITGPGDAVNNLVAEEFCVREKNTGADKWTYDDVVWFVKGDEYGLAFYPAEMTENGYYDAAEGATAVQQMTFENTYTENKPVPTATPKPSAPKTGDESALALWLTLVLGGTAAAAVVIGTRKKTDR